jgi:outer membrane lipopolysaccharide assembly protein LptE/RlpB
VRKARKAFEKELIQQRISEEAAQQLSRQLQVLKDQIMGSMWQLAFP